MKSRKKKASLFESMDERTLNFKQGCEQHQEQQQDNKKTALLRVSVMKASVNAQHQKLMSTLQKSSSFNHNGRRDVEDNSLVKQLKSLGHMFAPRKKLRPSEINETAVAMKTVAMKLKENKELFESLNYVLPIENFNHFKVLVPKSKLHLVAKDGEKVVVQPDVPNVSLRPDGLLKRHHATTRDVLNLFAATKRKSSKTLSRQWHIDDDSYIYVRGRRKYVIDKETGKFSYFYSASETPRIPNIEEHPDTVAHLGRNIFEEQPACLSVDPPFAKEFANIYPRLKSSRCNARNTNNSGQQSSRCSSNINVRLMEEDEEYESRTNLKFVIQSTRFGSFIEKYRQPEFKARRFRTRSFREREQQHLVELLEKIPNEFLPNRSRLGILRGSIQYIQSLQNNIRDELGISQGDDNDDPLAFINDVCRQADELVKHSGPIEIIDDDKEPPPSSPPPPLIKTLPSPPPFPPRTPLPQFSISKDAFEEVLETSEGMEVCDALYQHLYEYLCSSSSTGDHFTDIQTREHAAMTTDDLPWQQSTTKECDDGALAYLDDISDDRAQPGHFFDDVLMMGDDGDGGGNSFEQFVDLEGQLQFNYNDVNLNSLIGRREQLPSTLDTSYKRSTTAEDVKADNESNEQTSWDSLLNSLDDGDGHLSGGELFSDVKDHHQLQLQPLGDGDQLHENEIDFSYLLDI